MHIAFITPSGFIDDFTTDKTFKKHFNKLPRRNHGKSHNEALMQSGSVSRYFAGYYNELLYFFNTASNIFVTRQVSKVVSFKTSQIIQSKTLFTSIF